MNRLPPQLLRLGLALPLAAMALWAGRWAATLGDRYERFLAGLGNPEQVRALLALNQVPKSVRMLALVLWVAAGLLLLGAAAGCLRRRAGLLLLRCGYFSCYALLLAGTWSALSFTAKLTELGIPLHAEVAPLSSRGSFELALGWSLPWMGAIVGVALLHVLSHTRAAQNLYRATPLSEPAVGDRILEDLRTGGEDPAHRKSILSSAALQFFVIVVLPWLLGLFSCIDPFRYPEGQGEPAVAQAQFVPQQKREKKKQYIVNPNAPIIAYLPDLEESNLLEEVDQETQQTYTPSDLASRGGKMGAGGKGKGGWPGGVKDALVRFPRLRIPAADWDDGMRPGDGDADGNFLRFFHSVTGFRIKETGEANTFDQIARYDPGWGPAMIYMTGESPIGSVSDGDFAKLRNYLLTGAMLFVDAGTTNFDRSFREGFAPRLFPDKRLVTIAKDDPIFRMPYVFPNGPPPLWHHGQHQDMFGIWHKDRWIVVYYAGDLNDVWKTGHSGVDPLLARQAMQLGVNLYYHAITHYLDKTAKYRKK